MTHGPTPLCRGCEAAVIGGQARGHNQECRERFEQIFIGSGDSRIIRYFERSGFGEESSDAQPAQPAAPAEPARENRDNAGSGQNADADDDDMPGLEGESDAGEDEEMQGNRPEEEGSGEQGHAGRQRSST